MINLDKAIQDYNKQAIKEDKRLIIGLKDLSREIIFLESNKIIDSKKVNSIYQRLYSLNKKSPSKRIHTSHKELLSKVSQVLNVNINDYLIK